MRRELKIDEPAEVIRPFVMVAVLFFTTGFCGFLSLYNVGLIGA